MPGLDPSRAKRRRWPGHPFRDVAQRRVVVMAERRCGPQCGIRERQCADRLEVWMPGSSPGMTMERVMCAASSPPPLWGRCPTCRTEGGEAAGVELAVGTPLCRLTPTSPPQGGGEGAAASTLKQQKTRPCDRVSEVSICQWRTTRPYATWRASAHWLHRSLSAWDSLAMSPSVCSGVGVILRRSVPTGTVG